jgi:DNA-binding NarL/FixJ family response regulator
MSRARVILVAGHPVIAGIARLGCGSLADVDVVGEAPTAQEAAALIDRARPDAMVLDRDLPDEDGLAFLRRIRRSGFAGRVLLLGDAGGAAVLEAARLGVDGYLAKPDGLRRIGQVLRQVLDGEPVWDRDVLEAAVGELGRLAHSARRRSTADAALTTREREVLHLVGEGLTTRQMAHRLAISPRTVESHVGTLYRKLGAKTRVQALSKAVSLGLLDIG